MPEVNHHRLQESAAAASYSREMNRLLLLPVFLLLTAAVAPADTVFSDPFTDAQSPKERRASRGPWVIANGIAQVTQDDELYKKHQDHGPIVFYDLAFQDAVIEFAFQPEAAKTFVFTVNGAEGHIFRTVTSERGTNLRAFPPNGEAKSIALQNLTELPLQQGQWTRMRIELRGPQAIVTLGEHPPITVSHASLARPKTNASLGFSFGRLAMKDFTLRALD